MIKTLPFPASTLHFFSIKWIWPCSSPLPGCSRWWWDPCWSRAERTTVCIQLWTQHSGLWYWPKANWRRSCCGWVQRSWGLEDRGFWKKAKQDEQSQWETRLLHSSSHTQTHTHTLPRSLVQWSWRGNPARQRPPARPAQTSWSWC